RASAHDGGCVVLPAAVVQLSGQSGFRGDLAKPLKLRGSFPAPARLFCIHCAPQNITRSPMAACLSPMATPPPRGAKANPIVLQDVLATLPPTSWIDVATVNRPRVE